MDAAAGRLWPSDWLVEELADEPPRQATQVRHLERCARLLGFVGGEADRVSEVLGFDLVDHRHAQEAWKEATSRQKRGAVLRSILTSLEPFAWTRLIEAGSMSGCWGPVEILEGAMQRRPMTVLASRGPPHEIRSVAGPEVSTTLPK